MVRTLRAANVAFFVWQMAAWSGSLLGGRYPTAGPSRRPIPIVSGLRAERYGVARSRRFALLFSYWTRDVPMIAFNCPKCQANLQRNDAEAGSKIRCFRCNQKLIVPMPGVNAHDVTDGQGRYFNP